MLAFENPLKKTLDDFISFVYVCEHIPSECWSM